MIKTMCKVTVIPKIHHRVKRIGKVILTRKVRIKNLVQISNWVKIWLRKETDFDQARPLQKGQEANSVETVLKFKSALHLKEKVHQTGRTHLPLEKENHQYKLRLPRLHLKDLNTVSR